MGGVGIPVFHSGEYRPVLHRPAGAVEAVRNYSVPVRQYSVRVPAEKLDDKPALLSLAEHSGSVERKLDYPLALRLRYRRYPRANEVLSEEHTEHRRLRRSVVLPLSEAYPSPAPNAPDIEVTPFAARLYGQDKLRSRGLIYFFDLSSVKHARKLADKLREEYYVNRHQSSSTAILKSSSRRSRSPRR